MRWPFGREGGFGQTDPEVSEKFARTESFISQLKQLLSSNIEDPNQRIECFNILRSIASFSEGKEGRLQLPYDYHSVNNAMDDDRGLLISKVNDRIIDIAQNAPYAGLRDVAYGAAKTLDQTYDSVGPAGRQRFQALKSGR